MTLTEFEKKVAMENRARARCYRKYSRATKYLPNLPEEYRIEFMRRCCAEQIDKIIEEEKARIRARKNPEEEIRERNLERLEQIKKFKLYEESLVDPWE